MKTELSSVLEQLKCMEDLVFKIYDELARHPELLTFGLVSLIDSSDWKLRSVWSSVEPKGNKVNETPILIIDQKEII